MEKSTQNSVVNQPINISQGNKNSNQRQYQKQQQYQNQNRNNNAPSILRDDSIAYAVSSDTNNKARFQILKRNNRSKPSEYYKNPIQPTSITLTASPIRASSYPPKDLTPSPIDLGENEFAVTQNTRVMTLEEVERDLKETSIQSSSQHHPIQSSPPAPPPPVSSTSKDVYPPPPPITPQRVSAANSAYISGPRQTNVILVDKSIEKKSPDVKKGDVVVKIQNKGQKIVPRMMMPINVQKKSNRK